ncbi:MAG TPA: cytochrome P460 family protein [Pyrinomonadaceae bacterium]
MPLSSSGNSTPVPTVTSSKGTTRIIMPNDRMPAPKEKTQKNPHEKGNQTFARVFANEPASQEINNDEPHFAAGSIIVREKLLRETDTTPEIVTVMIKREKGFSPKTGDWEFFVLEGTLEKVEKRETVGSCAKCHAQAAKSDWVFKTYLK